MSKKKKGKIIQNVERLSDMERPIEKSYRKHLISIFILIAITIGVYSNSLFNDFVYDDSSTIIDNQLITEWNNIPQLLSTDYFKFSGEATYRPVVTLTYFIDYSLWGLKPFGYHLTNVLLHSMNVVFVYLFILSLSGNRVIAFLTALLFSVHPVQSEAVNAISFREDLLVVFFLLPAFLLFLKVSESSNMDKISSTSSLWWIFYILSLLLYSLALFSKEMAVTFPLLLIGYLLCFGSKDGRQERRTFIYLSIGYVAVSLIYLLLYFGLFSNPKPEIRLHPDFLTRLLTLPKVLVQYLWLIIAPYELNADYVTKFSRSWTDPSVVFSVFLLVGIGVVVFHLSKRYEKEVFGLLWFFITLLPVMNIIPIHIVIAERFLYLPLVGVSLFFSVWLLYLYRLEIIPSSSQFWKRGLIILLSIAVLLLGIRTLLRNMDWRDDLTLWSKTVITSPESARAHNGLAKAYDALGRYQEAIQEYKTALNIKTDVPDADYTISSNLGRAYAALGRWQEAIAEYQKAVRLKPDYPNAHYNLGRAYAALGRWEEAIAEYQKAMRLKPGDYADYKLLSNLGRAYTALGRWQEAIEEYQKVLPLNPGDPDAHYNLGIAYSALGRWQEAITEYQRTVEFKPDHPDAHYNLGIAYSALGRWQEAVEEYKKSLTIKKDDPDAHNNLGVIYYEQNRVEDALKEWEAALSINPDHEQAKKNIEGLKAIRERPP